MFEHVLWEKEQMKNIFNYWTENKIKIGNLKLKSETVAIFLSHLP